MTREEKKALIARMLGLRHKIKVHDSVGNASSHEELAKNSLTRWDLEDEIAAIENLLDCARRDNVELKLKQVKEKQQVKKVS